MIGQWSVAIVTVSKSDRERQVQVSLSLSQGLDRKFLSAGSVRLIIQK